MLYLLRLFAAGAGIALLAGCTSISCWYGPLDPGDEAPPDFPIGKTLEVELSLVGLLDESIDDKQIHYLNLVEPPGYRNRFVKARFSVPVGSRFAVSGYKRPHNPLCYSHDWKLVLSSKIAWTSNRDEINISVPTARSSMKGAAE